MITGVILNWKRPANIAQDSGQLATKRIGDRSNCLEQPCRRHLSPSLGQSHQRLARHGTLHTFRSRVFGTKQCLLIQDEDLELPVATLQRLWQAWQNEPAILHGHFRTRSKPDGSYARNVMGDTDVPVVCSPAPAGSSPLRRPRLLAVAPHFAELQAPRNRSGTAKTFCLATFSAAGFGPREPRSQSSGYRTARPSLHPRPSLETAHRTSITHCYVPAKAG